MIHNFNAGPSILPRTVVENAADAVLNLNGKSMSLLEISHRSKEFEAINNECIALWRELLNIPDDYKVLFLGGGASMQFCMLPYNLLNKKAAYCESGVWAKKAIAEAKLFGEVQIVASSKDENFAYYPAIKDVPQDADYLHITTNNTIYGTQLHGDVDSPVPIVADMSSDILARPICVADYDVIYGGAQKNAGTAGVTFVIIKESMLGKVQRKIPAMLDYRNHIENNSLYNTPPVFPIFVMLETLRWVKRQGGVDEMFIRNNAKAEILYNYLDSESQMFTGIVEPTSRSLMNIPFVMTEFYAGKENDFLAFAEKAGMVGLKGHRSVGGFRASLYNALPLESVKALVDCMREFERKNA
jgi:phosphoserine aminotransferase